MEYTPILNDNFKRWFGKSKVVDDNGQPLVCYHGSTVNISKFDLRYSGNTTGNNEEQVFYFTSDKDTAITYSQEATVRENEWKFYDVEESKNITFEDYEEYAEYLREQVFDDPKINPCYLRIENPYIHDADYTEFDYKKNYTLMTILKGNASKINYDIWDYDLAEELDGLFYEYDEEADEYISKDVSFDGVIIKNVRDNISPNNMDYIDEYIVWNPRQIKSVFNKGIWDMENDDVNENNIKNKNNHDVFKLTEDIISIKDFQEKTFRDNVKDFADSLIEMGNIANPSNPYHWVADKLEVMSKWNKKDWEYIFKKELSFKDIRSTQTTFQELSKQIRQVADAYEQGKTITITEKFEELQDKVWYTSSGYDVVNRMKNKPMPYRIVYDSNNGYYFLGDAYEYIHEDLMVSAFESGLYPEFDFEGDLREYMYESLENGTMLFCMFSPEINRSIDRERSSDGYTQKYIYSFGAIYAHEITPLEDFPLYSLLPKVIKKEEVYESFGNITQSLNNIVEEMSFSQLGTPPTPNVGYRRNRLKNRKRKKFKHFIDIKDV